MNRLTSLLAPLLLCLPVITLAAEDEDRTDLSVSHPLYPVEKNSAARLTRFGGIHLSWNDQNRIVAASLNGTDATNHAVALTARLLGLRALSLAPLSRTDLTDDGLAPLASHPALRSLRISGDRLSDHALVHIRTISSLEILILHGNFTNATLETISVLPNLKHLDLTQSHVNDMGLAHLPRLPHLETLVLNETDITTDGLDSIAELKKLAHLYLGDTAMDDGAVEQLKNLVQLETLFIKRTNISAEGVGELLPALPPTCKIIHDGGTDRGQRDPQTAMVHAPLTHWHESP
ncbi:MAG: hypothetical protein ACQESR_26470 [Planctomycetota bacterium]